MTKKNLFRWAALPAAAMLFVGGCQSSTVDKFPDPGQVNVQVKDQNAAAVSGATVDLVIPDNSLVWRSAVSDANGNASPGAADGGVLPGSYTVRVTPPSGYHLVTGSSNSAPITVQSNKTVSLTIIINIAAGP